MQTTPGHSEKIKVHGHRGSRGTHPENTIPAFEEAVKAKADALELDLHLSKDGVLYVVHDPFISSAHCTTKEGKPISKPLFIGDLTAAEIDSFDCGNVFNPNFPEQKNNLKKGIKIPSFEAFLIWHSQKAAQTLINAELKMDAPQGYLDPDKKVFSEKFLELVEKFNVQKKIFAQSFDLKLIETLRSLAPDLVYSCLFDSSEKDILKKTLATGCNYISPHKSYINPAFVKSCHEAGVKVVPWTLNSESEWENARKSCVDAVISDFPRRLVQFLKKK